MTISTPLVTIAIPTFNRSNYLLSAINSALSQSYANIEVIVSDNASTDETYNVVCNISDSRFKYNRHDNNLGQIANWNFCLNSALGEYFIMLSDDDILEANAIETFMKRFTSTNASLVYSKVTYIDEMGIVTGISRPSPISEKGESFIFNSFRMAREIFPSATMHRTDIARQFGGYPDIGTTTDLALRISLASIGIVNHINIPLVKYRVHQQSLSSSLTSIANSFNQFLDWLDLPENCHLQRYSEYILPYRNCYLYSLGRSLLLSGNELVYEETLSNLNKLSLDSTQRFIIFFLQFQFIRDLASSARNFKRKLVAFINGVNY